MLSYCLLLTRPRLIDWNHCGATRIRLKPLPGTPLRLLEPLSLFVYSRYNDGNMLLFRPSWSCTIIYCINRFTSLCKNFSFTWVFSISFSMPCASFSMLDGPGGTADKHSTWCTWHRKASAKNSVSENFLHSEMNLLIQRKHNKQNMMPYNISVLLRIILCNIREFGIKSKQLFFFAR